MHPVQRTKDNVKKKKERKKERKKEKKANCAYRFPNSFPPHQKFNVTMQLIKTKIPWNVIP
jgi:hypothetical protein